MTAGSRGTLTKGMDFMEEVTATVSQVEECSLLKLQETVTTMIREHPKDAVQIIRTWLLETGCQKAAVFFVTIGSELSSGIFKCLSEDEVETLTLEITMLETIEPDQKDAVLHEFHGLMLTNRFVSTGGTGFARELLKKSFGRQKAIDILNRVTASVKVQPFDYIRRTDPAILFNFLQFEHPQTIAVVLAYLEPNKASVILESLSHDMQSEVARRIAVMDRASPEVCREVERVLEKKLSTLSSEDYPIAGGIESIVEILNLVGRDSKKQIIETLENEDPELAEEIKKHMLPWMFKKLS
jgi:flagellar motor switch protein FliG